MLGRGHSATLCSYSPQQPALPSCKPQAPTLLRFSTPRHSSRAVEILVGLPIGQLLSDTEREVANTTSKSSQTFALPQASWIFQPPLYLVTLNLLNIKSKKYLLYL
jgi:hypothetical protein